MNFFKKDRSAKPSLSQGTASKKESKPVLTTAEGENASSMVRKPPRAPGSSKTGSSKKFERVARGAVTGDLQEALQEVTAALETEPQNDAHHMRRYDVLKTIGDKPLLRTALEESAEVTGRTFYAVKLAALLEEMENYPQALKWRKKVVEANPDDADAYKKVAAAYVRVGDLKGAEPAYLRLLELKSTVENPLGTSFLDDMTGRGLAYKSELQAMGLRILNRALEKCGESPYFLETAGRLAARAGQLDGSTECYELLINDYPKHASQLTWKGELLRVLARAGLPDKWLKLSKELIGDYEEHVRANRADVRAWMTLARLQMQAGLSAEALNSFKSAIRSDSREWQAVYEHGKLLVRMGRSDEAISWYEDVLSPFSSDAPEKPSVRRALERSLAELYFKLGRYQESLDIYTRDEEANLRFIGPLYEAVGQMERAEEMYNKSVAQAPKDAKGYLALSEYYVRRGKWDEVEKHARQGLACANSYEEVAEGLYVALATAQMNRRQVEEALSTMDAAVEESPDSASMLFRKVKLMILAKRQKEGKALAEKVLKLVERRVECAPAHSAYWSLLGDCYSLLGRQEDADVAYSTAIKFDAQDASAVRGLGVLAERRQDMRRAQELYKRFVTLDPLNLATLPIRQKLQEIEKTMQSAAPARDSDGDDEPSPPRRFPGLPPPAPPK